MEPVFEAGEALAGHTDRFMFDTPFTKDGQSYAANIADQCVLDFDCSSYCDWLTGGQVQAPSDTKDGKAVPRSGPAEQGGEPQREGLHPDRECNRDHRGEGCGTSVVRVAADLLGALG